MGEALIDELKRYIGFTADDAARLRAFAPLVEPHLAELSERFYAQIPAHPEAAAVFTGGAPQIARLKLTLQRWARGLFSGVYDAAYAEERFQIGVRHVQIGLPQRYVIGAMHVVEDFLRGVIDESVLEPERSPLKMSLSRIINLDLNLICETYFAGTMRQLRGLNDELAIANRALAEADRLKDQFLATTSHELRTPLTSIIGFATLLIDGYIPDEAGRREAVADIHRSAVALLALVEDLLDISRIQAGRLEMRIEAVSVAVILADVGTTMAVQAREKSIVFDCAADPDLPPALADRARVRQIVLNLAGNAMKFTDQGSVKVAADYEAESHRVRITVADTGIGIPVDQQSQLFEAFHQLNQGHTRQYGGAGLGLSISKALVEHMGGAIRVESAGVGQGTTAFVWLPVADRTAAVAPAPERRRRQPTLLLVANDAVARQQLRTALGPAGYLVREGGTADSVRAMITADRPDVLLVDLTAGETDTLEWVNLLVRLTSDPQAASMSIVALVDRSTPDAARSQMAFVATHATLVDKPKDVAALQQLLGRVAGPSAMLRLVVADDDPLVIKFLRQILPTTGYELVEARSGQEVITLLDQSRYDAVILDLRMPSGSGYDVLRALTGDHRHADLPVVVLTNYPTPRNASERDLLSSPVVVDLLSKPTVAAHPEVLLDRLRQLSARTTP